MVAIELIPRAKGYEVLPPKISPSSFLGDIVSVGEEKEEQITAGFFKVVPGEPLVYTYPYDEVKICLEVQGDFIISDSEGNELHPKAGDVIRLPKGCVATFSVVGDEDAYSYNFYCGKKYFGQL
ncbi:CYFA0S03e02344g1_1 [Cyberlindnera fabianii]|uniref:CYFA0S03e02344g1_1 n=1 Tax=Cyberlindnera fabianii TaxID=36022 RepID=A0A061AXA3_CYBFA|nr:hypothetical protein BON22_4511 [Cyberlindnera fabianii]CDR39346.1 CYFA0S03e02344g1_1 [Cyberlindnera fabianii]